MTKVIAEIGINHKSDELVARELIDHAHYSGCWAIKFQYRNFEGFYSSTDEIGDELISEQLKNSHLNLNQIRKLTTYAKSKKLKVGISFFTMKDFNEILSSKINFDFFKIPSAEFSNTDLVSRAKATKKVLILSTGGHNLIEIKNNIKQYNFKNNAIILHCTSNYPSEIGSQNLETIKELKKIPNIKIGYSSHDIDYEVVFLAASLGAEYIERHITLNKLGSGLDDSSSSELEEFIRINKILKNYSQILGDSKKPVNQGEVINLQNLGTALYSKAKIKKNKFVNLADFNIQAPRKGLTQDQIKKYLNKPLLKDLEANEPITKSHFIKKKKLNQKDFDFLNHQKISIPIRFHDMEAIFNEFKIRNYEFHLSYEEVKNSSLIKLKKQKRLFENKIFSYHLPDYINSHQLFDPLSKDKSIRQESIKLLNKAIKISQITSTGSKDPIIFVSSLSQNNYVDKDIFFMKLKIFIEELYKNYNILFLPQWLPKKAWYFGGTYDIKLFSTFEDINFIKKYNIQICLDIAHLIMSANASEDDWRLWLKKLMPFSRHIHLSDSYGIDGEGVEFGKGELGNPKKIMSTNQIKVLEIWQGHLNDFEGFKSAVKSLRSYY
jgi:sialic acid synthase SpsE